ncbi:hypothetical protein SNE40_003927 [Patella caerulea]|uniref:AIG1-type G domain-containing protein n=1 Tax=Patella caerulea TaxID=87958 RepID=A0AAN8KF98_PATCE
MPERTSATRIRSLTSKAVQDKSDTSQDSKDSPNTLLQSKHHSAVVDVVQSDTIHDDIQENNDDISQTIAQANGQSVPMITQTDSLQATGVYHPVENISELEAEHCSGNVDPLAVQLIGPPNRDGQLQHTAFTETALSPKSTSATRIPSPTSKAVQDKSDTDHDSKDSPNTYLQSQHHSAEVDIVQHDTIHDSSNDINHTIAQANGQSVPQYVQSDGNTIVYPMETTLLDQPPSDNWETDTDDDSNDSPNTHLQSQHHSAEVDIVQSDTILDDIHDNNNVINHAIAQANGHSVPQYVQSDGNTIVYPMETTLPPSDNRETDTDHDSKDSPNTHLQLQHHSAEVDIVQHDTIHDDNYEYNSNVSFTITDGNGQPIPQYVQSDGYTIANPMETTLFDQPPSDISETELKIVISGKSGVGKSFLGNCLLAKQLFESRQGFGSITSKCSSGTRTLNDGTIIRVYDTPGMFDTRHKTAELVKHMFSLSSLTAPGPHVFLYVLRVDERLTMENWDSIDLFRDIFGAEVNKYVIFVFNRKPKEIDAQELIDSCTDVKTILKEYHNRYVTINFADSDTGVEKCIDNLLQMIRDTVEDNDQKHYSSAVFEEAERAYYEKQNLKKTQDHMIMEIAELRRQLYRLQKKSEAGSMKKECGPMREQDYDKVRKFFQVILTNVTNPPDLCIALFSKGLLDADDKDQIEAIEDRKKQCNKLLTKVMNECGPNAYPRFLDALTSTGHQCTRDLLEAPQVYYY